MARATCDETTAAGADSAFMLNVAVAFQDVEDRERALEVCAKVNALVGTDCVQSTWWKIDHLIDTGLLSNAVQAAVEADVVVVSLQAGDILPAGLCAWVDGWLLRREGQLGALVALIGVQQGAGAQASRTREYLKTVASSGRMDFLPNEHALPMPAKTSPASQTVPPTGLSSVLIYDLHSHDDNSFPHWGINE